MQEMWVQSLCWEDPWRRKWQPTPVLFPGKSHGQRSPTGYSPWGHQEADSTEATGQAPTKGGRIQDGGSVRAGGAGAAGGRGLRNLSPSGKSTLLERGYPIQLMHTDSCKPARPLGESSPWDPAALPSPCLGSARIESSEEPLLGLHRPEGPPKQAHTLCPGTSARSPQPSPTAPPHLRTPGGP